MYDSRLLKSEAYKTTLERAQAEFAYKMLCSAAVSTTNSLAIQPIGGGEFHVATIRSDGSLGIQLWRGSRSSCESVREALIAAASAKANP